MEVLCKHCNIDCEYLSSDSICEDLSYLLSSNTLQNADPIQTIPNSCTHYGKIFLEFEQIKQKVRKYKEEIVYYEALIESGCKEEKVYKKIIDSLNRFIQKYEALGSKNW